MIFKKNKILFTFIILGLLGGLVFYYYVDPLSEHFLIRCPFKTLTGLDCPGCGSQRAVHELLHGNFKAAFSYNALFIIAIPYAFVGILFEYFSFKYKYPKIRKFLFGRTAIYIISATIILFSILRNL